MKRIKRVCIVGVLFTFMSLSGAEPNELCKIFHHDKKGNDSVLEEGNVVFYFVKEP